MGYCCLSVVGLILSFGLGCILWNGLNHLKIGKRCRRKVVINDNIDVSI
jgi:hypothetical protein